jgi:hypothetical protein
MWGAMYKCVELIGCFRMHSEICLVMGIEIPITEWKDFSCSHHANMIWMVDSDKCSNRNGVEYLIPGTPSGLMALSSTL